MTYIHPTEIEAKPMLSDGKFTKGPWRADISNRLSEDSDCWVVDSEEGAIAELMCPADVAEANARLIAAAPDLYSALQTLDWAGQVFNKPSLGQRQFIGAFKKALDEARAALRLVTGEGE